MLAMIFQTTALPPPTRLLAELLPCEASTTLLTGFPLGLATRTPRLTFAIPAAAATASRGLAVASYHIVVACEGSRLCGGRGAVAWDSGVVKSNDTSGTIVGSDLTVGAIYTWSAEWSAADGRVSPQSNGTFGIGLLSPGDWAGTQWFGGGMNEFRTRFNVTAAADHALASLHIASAGGVVVRVNGIAITSGGAASGDGSSTPTTALAPHDIHPWSDFTKSVSSTVYDLRPYALPMVENEVTVSVGCAGWCRTPALAWAHSARTIYTTEGALPIARMRLLVEDGIAGGAAPGAAASVWEGRAGVEIKSDIWTGSIIDWRRNNSAWSPAKVLPAATIELDVPDEIRPLQAPPSRPQELVHAISVRAITERDGESDPTHTYVYSLPTMVVGTAVIQEGTYSSGVNGGNISIQYCELLKTTTATPPQSHLLAPGACEVFTSQYPVTGIRDIHMLPPSNAGGGGGGGDSDTDSDAVGAAQSVLAAQHTWTGFQHLVVRVTGDATFDGKLDSIVAVWGGAVLEATGSITFGGTTAGVATLTGIHEMVKKGTRSNILSHIPTDCPSREKHGWLGDAMDLTEGAMHHFWTPGVYEFFLEQIRDSQNIGGPTVNSTLSSGDVEVAVPVHAGVDDKARDLAWTAGYPIITNWLLLYHGTHVMAPTIRKHWTPLKRWVTAQLKHANNTGMDGLPSMTTYGDQENPVAGFKTARFGAGLSAANFIIAIEAMATMADAIGESTDAATYRAAVINLKHKYETQFWNSTNGMGYASLEAGIQTLNAITLSAGIGTRGRDALAAAALLADVRERNANHLAVGHAGAKYLLNTLSGLTASTGDPSYHDTALRVATQVDYPSWGNFIAQVPGTTCWETWDGKSFEHTRNHGWLCGGIGEWMYKYLAGIQPSSPGFATVTIAPVISRTIGPSSVNATMQTIRGPVHSSWTRLVEATHLSGGEVKEGEESSSTKGGGGLLLRMLCALPIGTEGTVTVPLLGRSPNDVTLSLLDNDGEEEVLVTTMAGVALWSRGRGRSSAVSVAGVRAVAVTRNGAALAVEVGSGAYVFELKE